MYYRLLVVILALLPLATPAITGPTATTAPTTAAYEVNRFLDKVLPEVRFENVPLEDAIEFLRDVTGVSIFVNWRAIEEAGMSKHTPITLNVRQVTVRELLRLLSGNTDPGLSVTIEDVLHIRPATTKPATKPAE